MKKLKLLTIVLLSLLTFSCQTDSLNTSETIRNADTELDLRAAVNSIENAPDQSGYFLTRGEDILGILYVDFKTGLTGVAGANNDIFCNPFPNPEAFQLVPTQKVDIPNAVDRFQIIQKGETYFEIYEGVLDRFLCDFIQVAPKIASGYASMVLTDNDQLAFSRDATNKNAFGFTAKGTLSDQNGDPVNFKTRYRVVWDGVNFSTPKVVSIQLD